eukprot:411640-Prymnesium_polylepis.1
MESFLQVVSMRSADGKGAVADDPEFAALRNLDEKQLVSAITSGAIRLLNADTLRNGDLLRIERRQDLEVREANGEHVFLTADEATAALRSAARRIGCLTYHAGIVGEMEG